MKAHHLTTQVEASILRISSQAKSNPIDQTNSPENRWERFGVLLVRAYMQWASIENGEVMWVMQCDSTKGVAILSS